MFKRIANAASDWRFRRDIDLAGPPPPGRGRRAPVPDDNAGFVPIFDGKTLKNWDGEPGFWRVEDGVLIGRNHARKAVEAEYVHHLARRDHGGFRIQGRIQDHRIRPTAASSTAASPLPDVGKWVLKGYQADIDGKNNYTGMLYEERGRGLRGAARPVRPHGRRRRAEADRQSRAIPTP